MHRHSNVRFLFLGTFITWSLVVQPVLADRPPEGEARPPIHVKGDATKAPTGLSPKQIRHFYGFDQILNQGAGQTIAIVDAYDDPNIASDLATFISTFSLPACDFTKIYASGIKPKTDPGWSLEISLDVEWAHAIAPQAKIILVEAASNSFANLIAAVNVAVGTGASVVSMSFGGSEFSGQTTYDPNFNVGGVTFTASSGDSGSGVEYPAASPYVVAVGGTTIKANSDGTYNSETAWSGSGGGQSAFEQEPTYQVSFGISSSNKRGVPDVAYDADPNTGFSVYDTVRYQGQAGWFQVGGTSAGAPQWAALIAIVNSMRAAASKGALTGAQTPLYNTSAYGTNFHDITSGSNGTCGTLCKAAGGYDFVTGLGSPQAAALVSSLVAY